MKPHCMLLTIWCLATPALADKAHVHGEGRLDVAIGKDTLAMDLELPLDVAVGFERAPRGEKEKANLSAAEKTLRDAVALWQPSTAANCVVETADVAMPRFASGEHADIEARYSFRCANPTQLKEVSTAIFKQFPRLYRLEVQRVGPSGQGRHRLTPKNPSLAW
jgi:hypothetical protein